MTDGTFYTCGGCREVIDPKAPDTVPARQQITTPTYGGGPTE